MPTLIHVTQTAESILAELEANPGLQRELHTYFRERWEQAAGVNELRERLDADLLAMEEREGDAIEELNTLKEAAQELVEAIERDRPAKGSARVWLTIDAKAKALKALCD